MSCLRFQSYHVKKILDTKFIKAKCSTHEMQNRLKELSKKAKKKFQEVLKEQIFKCSI